MGKHVEENEKIEKQGYSSWIDHPGFVQGISRKDFIKTGLQPPLL